ncbi:MAG: hypothetical protein IRZ00_02390 [Gemmatimonadetes bacterium]|nr:hypothetical protein [Gemmatimonadota bacterium]
MRRALLGALVGWTALSGATPAAAQRTSLLLRLPASARALALGDHFPAGYADVSGVFYEPAFLQDGGIYAGGQAYGGGALTLDAAGAVEWLGGIAALGLRGIDYDAAADPRIVQVRPSALDHEGGVPVAERAVSVTFAHGVKKLRLGASAKLVEERIGADHGASVAFDASAGATLGLLRVAVTALNLGPDVEVGAGDLAVPERYTASLTSTVPLPTGPLDVTPVLAVSREWTGRIAPAFGLELGYWPVSGRTLYVRGGVRRPPEDGTEAFTVGAGFSGDRISIDYAYEPLDDAAGGHRVALRWTTGGR